MVLERHPKKYKHLIRIMLTQLVQHQNITTTRAKAKHLKVHAERLMLLAKKAYRKQRSPLNLLKGRINTKKAEKKLLVDILPRVKTIRGGFIVVKDLNQRRRGDNAPMVQIYIKGNEKTQFQNKRKQQALQKKLVPNIVQYHSKILAEQKQYLQKLMKQNPEKESFFKQKIQRVELQQWVLGKNKKQPPKYTLLV